MQCSTFSDTDIVSSNVYDNHKYKFYLKFRFNDKTGRLDDTSTKFA